MFLNLKGAPEMLHSKPQGPAMVFYAFLSQPVSALYFSSLTLIKSSIHCIGLASFIKSAESKKDESPTTSYIDLI